MPTLRGLDRAFRPMAESFFHYARTVYPGITVTSARRSRWEQERLYSAYLRGGNDGLPAAPPGTSDHEFGLAFDLARPGTRPQDDPGLMALGQDWQRAWGGRWSASDPVHFAAPSSVKRRPRKLKARRRRA